MSAETKVAQCPMGHGDCPSDCLNHEAATKLTDGLNELNELGDELDPFEMRTAVVFGDLNPEVSLENIASALARCAKEEAPKNG